MQLPSAVLVTGGAGFIGSHLVERILLDHPECTRVRILDNLSTGHIENIQMLLDNHGSRVEFLNGDIRDFQMCKDACKDMHAILHEAALGSVPRSVRDPMLTHKNNVDGFENMIVAAKEEGIKRFVYASSSSVYGSDQTLPKIEHQTGEPLSPYAASKAFNELIANVFAKLYDMQCIGLRYFNVFGPRQDPNGAYAAVIPKFISLLQKDERPVIFGDGSAKRDFTFVKNVVDANMLALSVPAEKVRNGFVCNVGAAGCTEVRELVTALQHVMQKKDVQPIYSDARLGDIRESFADITRAKKTLGYNATVPFEDGLKRTVAFFASNGC